MQSIKSKSEIAAMFNADIRTIHGALESVKDKFPYWFTRKKNFFPAQYKPILDYLEGEQGFISEEKMSSKSA